MCEPEELDSFPVSRVQMRASDDDSEDEDSEDFDKRPRIPIILRTPKLRSKASAGLTKRRTVIPSTDGQPLLKRPKAATESSARSTTTASKYLSQPTEGDFAGDAGFSYHFPPVESFATSTWDYSAQLNCVFIRLEKILVVHFKFDRAKLPDKDDVFIRAVLVFRNPDSVHKPVDRCSMHWVTDDPGILAHREKHICQCLKYNLTGHIIRSPTPGTVYCYDPTSGRHSITSPVQRSSDVVYSFSCQNSCPKGMERRPVKLVFSLENSREEVFGRASVSIKICCCPKRDKDKLERESLKQLPSITPNPSTPAGNKEVVKRALMDQLNEMRSINLNLKARCRVIEEALEDYCENGKSSD